MAKRNQRELAPDLPDGGVSRTSAGVGSFEVLRDCFHAHPLWKSLQEDRVVNCYNIESSSSQDIPPGRGSKGRAGGEEVTAQDAGMLHKSRSPSYPPAGFNAGVGSFEVLRDCFHAHPLWKRLQEDKVVNCYNIELSSSQEIPRGRRSKRRVGGEEVTVRDAGMLHRSPPSCLPAGFNGSHEVSIVEESRSQSHLATHPLRPRNVRRKQKGESSDSEVISQPSLRYCRQSRRLHGKTNVIQKWEKLDTEKFECYMQSLWRRFTAEEKSVFTCLDSLWFSLYTKETYKEKVLSWIKRKDIFSKKYVFVPIVQWGHWFLLIFCHFGESPQSETNNRCMLLLDSLQDANSKQLEPGIRRFVFDIFKKEERPEAKELINKIPLLIPKVPQQKGGEECGFFVLYYINLFLESARDNISFSLGYPNFMKEDWFTPEEVESFIKNLDSTNKSSDLSD